MGVWFDNNTDPDLLFYKIFRPDQAGFKQMIVRPRRNLIILHHIHILQTFIIMIVIIINRNVLFVYLTKAEYMGIRANSIKKDRSDKQDFMGCDFVW